MAILRKSTPVSERDNSGFVLLLQRPRTNDKKELAAEQMLTAASASPQGMRGDVSIDLR